jgi:predicted deacylase
MSQEATRQLALLQNPQLIVHNPPSDGTLRGAADALDIPAVTLEVGNPGVYQKKLIRSGMEGVHNVLSYLNMTSDEVIAPASPPIICKRSYWIYTHTGGLLTVEVDLLQSLKAGNLIATQRDVFGSLKEQYLAPEDGVVIGKSTMPVNRSGGRILHLGIL